MRNLILTIARSWLFNWLLAMSLLSACGHSETKDIFDRQATTSCELELTPQAVELAAIKSFYVTSTSSAGEIQTTGQIKADENRVFHINSIVSGRVLKDNVFLGKGIKAGENLAIIQNLEVAKIYGDYIHQAHQNEIDVEQAQAKLELANKNLARLSALNKEGIVAEKDLFTAQNQQKLLKIEQSGLKEHAIHIKAEAEALLSAYGVTLDENLPGGTIDPHHIKTGSPLLAPRSGVVIEKNVTVGDVVTPTQVLYVVADLSQVWLDIAIYDKDLPKIHEGELIEFHSDSVPSIIFKGQISYIQPSAGDNTRTFLARAVLPNPQSLLKPGMFGQVTVTSPSSENHPFLPDDAIQQYGDQKFVFIDLNNNRFEKRLIQLGNHVDNGYLVLAGVKEGEKVVGSGSFKLKSELLKSQIGKED